MQGQNNCPTSPPLVYSHQYPSRNPELRCSQNFPIVLQGKSERHYPEHSFNVLPLEQTSTALLGWNHNFLSKQLRLLNRGGAQRIRLKVTIQVDNSISGIAQEPSTKGDSTSGRHILASIDGWCRITYQISGDIYRPVHQERSVMAALALFEDAIALYVTASINFALR